MVYGPTPSNPVGGDHGDFLAALAQFLKPWRYLELGVADGATFAKVIPHVLTFSIGVDLNPGPGAFAATSDGKSGIFRRDTVAFMEEQPPQSFDLIFLDSSHEYKATIGEIREIERVIVQNGVLAMHDTYPPSKEQERQGYCGDVWRVAERLIDWQGWECMTLAAQYGITLARRLPESGSHLAWKA